MSEQENSLRCDYVPGCGYKIWQDAKEFCYTTDAVFLGNFPHVVRKAKVLSWAVAPVPSACCWKAEVPQR